MMAMSRPRLKLLCIFLFSGFASLLLADTHSVVGGPTVQTIVLTDGRTFPIIQPANLTKTRVVPVILFLHGAGDRGVNNGHLTVGLPKVILDREISLDALIIAPQIPKGSWWSDPAMESFAIEALERVVEMPSADQTRVYLTGLSMGGHGTWQLAAQFPEKFAALVPICARVGRPKGMDIPENSFLALNENNLVSGIVDKIKHIPTWIFHGSKDSVVPVEDSRAMYRTLAAVNPQAKYREYWNSAHNAWVAAYREPELYTWLFQQRLDRQR